MEQKELVIEALNRAIRVWKSEVHQPTWGDVVVDFNVDRCKIASYLTRHPGCIMLPVLLEEGSGFIFLRSDTKILRNVISIAWESDNEMHQLETLMSEAECENLKDGIEKIISNCLYR
jgi:hypothetical protein